MVEWQPIRQDIPWDVGTLEAALGRAVPEALRELFGTWWSAPLETRLDGEPVILPLPWNRLDRDRLTSALVTEAQLKRFSGQAPTFFVANTNDDRMWVMDVRDESVWIEEVGYPPSSKVAESLADFLGRLGRG